MSLEDWIKEAEASEQQQFTRIDVYFELALKEYENWYLAQLGSMGDDLDADEVEQMRENCLRMFAQAFTRLYPGQRKQ